jgi:hypothetical protein
VDLQQVDARLAARREHAQLGLGLAPALDDRVAADAADGPRVGLWRESTRNVAARPAATGVGGGCAAR